MTRLILFTDASFYRDDRGPITAAIAVVDGPGNVLVDELVDVDTNTRAERRAMSAALKIARDYDGPVEIRTDSTATRKMHKGDPTLRHVTIEHIGRRSNARANQIARKRARADLKLRGLWYPLKESSQMQQLSKLRKPEQTTVTQAELDRFAATAEPRWRWPWE